MSGLLEGRLERLERAKARLLADLEPLSDETFNRAPAAGEWSVAQVLCHVSLAEELSVAYLRKKAGSVADAPPAGVASGVKSWLLSLALRSPFRFKAPARSAEVPERRSFEEVSADWDRIRRELAEILSTLGEEAAHRAIFKHPRAGRLSLDQALRFMEDHLEHHSRQVGRVLRRVGAPAAGEA